MHSPEQVREIIAKYQAGSGQTALAREYGCSTVTISHILKREGVPARPFLLTVTLTGIEKRAGGKTLKEFDSVTVGVVMAMHLGRPLSADEARQIVERYELEEPRLLS